MDGRCRTQWFPSLGRASPPVSGGPRHAQHPAAVRPASISRRHHGPATADHRRYGRRRRSRQTSRAVRGSRADAHSRLAAGAETDEARIRRSDGGAVAGRVHAARRPRATWFRRVGRHVLSARRLASGRGRLHGRRSEDADGGKHAANLAGSWRAARHARRDPTVRDDGASKGGVR